MAQRLWTRDELLVAFSLYCRLPFGQYDQGNPQVKRVAGALGRTASAVAMRLSNFASLDPAHKARGIKGLGRTGPTLVKFWHEVTADWTTAALDTEAAWNRAGIAGEESHLPPQLGRTETQATVKVRVVQGFFRRTVLASYEGSCAFCGVRPEPLLTASHIIPWSESETRRADPTNGLSLCALHDRAFDQGLLALDEKLRVLVSSRLQVKNASLVHREALLNIHGQPMTPPTRYEPDPAALNWHRRTVFAP